MTVYLTIDEISAIRIALTQREFELMRMLGDSRIPEDEALYTIELKRVQDLLRKLACSSDDIVLQISEVLRRVYFESLT